MDADMQRSVTQWQNLKSQAESGDLRMDPEIGGALRSHAEKMRTDLNRLLVRVDQLQKLTGFGTLNSAVALREKFEKKAIAGDDSATERLRQSIDVLTLMAETYEKASRTIQDADQSNSQKLASVDPGAV